MKKRIIIECEAEEPVVDRVIRNIEAVAIGELAGNELESCHIRKETLPERISTELSVPSFLVRRPFATERG